MLKQAEPVISGTLRWHKSNLEINHELEEIIQLLLHDFVHSWYTTVSTDQEFLQQLLTLASLLLETITQRLSHVDWVAIFTLHMPRLLAVHVRDWRMCVDRRHDHRTLAEIFHNAFQPHTAMQSPEDEQAYARNRVEEIITILVASVDTSAVSEEVHVLMTDALTWVMLDTVQIMSEPRYVADLILRTTFDDNSERVRRPRPLIRHYNVAPTTQSTDSRQREIIQGRDFVLQIQQQEQKYPARHVQRAGSRSSMPILKHLDLPQIQPETVQVHNTLFHKPGNFVRGHGRSISAFITKLDNKVKSATHRDTRNAKKSLDSRRASTPLESGSSPTTSIRVRSNATRISKKLSARTSPNSSQEELAELHYLSPTSSHESIISPTQEATSRHWLEMYFDNLLLFIFSFCSNVKTTYSRYSRLRVELNAKTNADGMLGPLQRYSSQALDVEWFALLNTIFDLEVHAAWSWWFWQGVLRPLAWTFGGRFFTRLILYTVWMGIRKESVIQLLQVSREALWGPDTFPISLDDPSLSMPSTLRSKLVLLLDSLVPSWMNVFVGGRQTIHLGLERLVDAFLGDPVILRHFVWALFDLGLDAISTEAYCR